MAPRTAATAEPLLVYLICVAEARSTKGLADVRQGQKGGTESLGIQTNNMPTHSHGVLAVNQFADQKEPNSNSLASAAGDQPLYSNGKPNTRMNSAMIENAGGGQAIAKRIPYLAMLWCVAEVGNFPSRN